MQFCVICPNGWLTKFALQQKTHLVLAHLLEDPAYFNFYHQLCMDPEHTVILDNGAYEESRVDFKLLVDIISTFRPDYYVLPDEPNTFRESSQLSLDFIKFAKSQPLPVTTKRLWVVHAEDHQLDDFTHSYELGVLNAHGICFSRLTNTYGLNGEMPEMRRVQFIDYLKQMSKWNTSKYHHCLGLLRGSLCELPHLASQGVDSVDSSAPIWRGLNGYRLNEYWPDFPFELNPRIVAFARSNANPDLARGEALAQRNLQEVLEACQPSR